MWIAGNTLAGSYLSSELKNWLYKDCYLSFWTRSPVGIFQMDSAQFDNRLKKIVCTELGVKNF